MVVVLGTALTTGPEAHCSNTPPAAPAATHDCDGYDNDDPSCRSIKRPGRSSFGGSLGGNMLHVDSGCSLWAAKFCRMSI